MSQSKLLDPSPSCDNPVIQEPRLIQAAWNVLLPQTATCLSGPISDGSDVLTFFATPPLLCSGYKIVGILDQVPVTSILCPLKSLQLVQLFSIVSWL